MLAVLTVLIFQGLLVLVHELVSAIAAYEMGDATINQHVVGQNFFPTEMFG